MVFIVVLNLTFHARWFHALIGFIVMSYLKKKVDYFGAVQHSALNYKIYFLTLFGMSI